MKKENEEKSGERMRGQCKVFLGPPLHRLVAGEGWGLSASQTGELALPELAQPV